METTYSYLEQATESAKSRFLEIPLIKMMLTGGSQLPQEALREIYINFLVESYYHVKEAPKVYGLAGSRILDDNENVRRWLLAHSYEEHGHHEWILNDLKNLGVNPEKVVSSKPHFSTSGLVGFMYYTAGHLNPIGTLGDSFVIEGLSSYLQRLFRNH